MEDDLKKSMTVFVVVETQTSKGLGFDYIILSCFTKKRLKPTSLPNWATIRTEELSSFYFTVNYSVNYSNIMLLSGLDHFGLQITHGHNTYNNSRGIFVVKTAGQVRADIQPRDQLIKITWKKANQSGIIETCNLTENIDDLKQVTQRIFNIPINVFCTLHYKRYF